MKAQTKGLLGILLDIILLIGIIYLGIQLFPAIQQSLPFLQQGINLNIFSNLSSSIAGSSAVPQNALINYTLNLINKDRAQYGLAPVNLSVITSGQEHAQSMLADNYFSHWDPSGMKPYMRYTLLNGKGAVSENIAYQYKKVCIGSFCTSFNNVESAIKDMEYSMLYNDSSCCNNEHRENILDPEHTQVSIGVATNGTNIYLTQDFINNYIDWFNNTPKINGDVVELTGDIPSGDKLSTIEVTYDPTPQPMTLDQLGQTKSYSYGKAIAGVAHGLYYYPNLTTISASRYYYSGNKFDVVFGIKDQIAKYGAGAYTLVIWLDGSQGSFVASTYTIFINENGSVYIPSSI